MSDVDVDVDADADGCTALGAAGAVAGRLPLLPDPPLRVLSVRARLTGGPPPTESSRRDEALVLNSSVETARTWTIFEWKLGSGITPPTRRRFKSAAMELTISPYGGVPYISPWCMK